jgi:hypothetical protein
LYICYVISIMATRYAFAPLQWFACIVMSVVGPL